jgi:hypothetical protein
LYNAVTLKHAKNSWKADVWFFDIWRRRVPAKDIKVNNHVSSRPNLLFYSGRVEIMTLFKHRRLDEYVVLKGNSGYFEIYIIAKIYKCSSQKWKNFENWTINSKTMAVWICWFNAIGGSHLEWWPLTLSILVHKYKY